jgi:hypothetical protein
MKKLAVTLSLFLVLQATTVLANEINRDPFTVFVQEILIDIGLLDTPATGVNDKATQKAIMSFQEKAGLEKIDGIVGGETFPKLLQGETAYTTTTTFIDTHPPEWAEDPLSIINVNNNWAAPTVMRATILWGHVTDNVGIDEFKIYVDGELYITIPGLGCVTNCSSQSSGVNARISNLIKDNYHTIEVRACDEDGNCSTNNPTITKEFKETVEVATTTTTTTTTTTVPTGKLADCGDSSTNANRWVVAVIDEDDSQSLNTMTAQWTSFRTDYPDRCFHLLEPYAASYSNRSNPNGIGSSIAIPTAFINELSAGTTFHSRVNRDGGSTASRSDWWDLIGADVLPSGAKIGLCIDNSGSMNVNTVRSSLNLFKQKAAAAGVTIVTGLNGNSSTYDCSGMTVEQWISGLRIDIN